MMPLVGGEEIIIDLTWTFVKGITAVHINSGAALRPDLLVVWRRGNP